MPFIGLSKPEQQSVSEQLNVGSLAPHGLTSTDRYNLVVFLRHTGCPFAEAMLKELSEVAELHPELNCIAVLHGDQDVAQAWVNQFDLAPELQLSFDEDRSLYGKWGLGYEGIFHLAHPAMVFSWITLLLQGIHNRDASGTRWQPHASFLVSPDQTIQWIHYPHHAGDLPDLNEAAAHIWN